MLRSGDAEGKKNAAGALWNLAGRYAGNKEAITNAGAIEPLIELLQHGDTEKKKWAAIALKILRGSEALATKALGFMLPMA